MRVTAMILGAAALVALSGGTAQAQGRGNGRGREHAPGQLKREERLEGARFYPRDRELARNWYYHERHDRGALPPGLRARDRLPPELLAVVRPGWVVEPGWRAQLYVPPVALVRVFPPPPVGYRYFVFGGDVLLVDGGYRVADVIGLDINLGY